MPSFDIFHVRADGSVSTSMRCTSCGLCKNPELVTNMMPGSGPENATFLLVGHQPGTEDDGIGKPFTGSNGRLLRKILSEASINLDSCYLTNALKCSLRGGRAKDSYWKKCKGHFVNELKRIKPKAIVSFGGTALKWLTGFSGVRRFRRRGLPCVLDPSIMVYPFEQAISLQNYEGADYQRARAQMVSDFIWLRDRATAGKLYISDETPLDYRMAKTTEEVEEFLSEFPAGSEVYADLETSTENFKPALFPYPGNKIVAIGFSNGAGHARTIPYQARGLGTLTYWKPEEESYIKTLLGEFWRTHHFVGHNFVQFDHKWISVHWDIDQLDIRFEPMLASHLLDETPGTHGLEDLVLRYTQMAPWKGSFNLKDIRKLCTYLSKDVDGGWRLLQVLREELSPAQMWLHENVQMRFAHEARRMEQRGIPVDENAIATLEDRLGVLIQNAEKEIHSIPEVQAWELANGKKLNTNAPHQVADLMENYLKLPKIKETGTGNYATGADVLEEFEDKVPFCKWELAHRRSSKLLSTYVTNIKERVKQYGPRIHYSIKVHGTVTGRPAGSDPNMYNLPRADTAERTGIDDPKLIKAMFVTSDPETRRLIQADYSQAELRTLAMLSGDEALIQTYLDDLDAHSATAARMFNVPIKEVQKYQRQAAKIVNFGIIYGKQESSVVDDFVSAARIKARKDKVPFTVAMEKEAEESGRSAFATHQKVHPGVWKFMHNQERIIRSRGWQETPFGRIRRYHKIDNAAIRQSYNTPIQSSAAEFTHIAIGRLGPILRQLGYDAPMVVSVYDSIVLDCPIKHLQEVARIAKDVMEGIYFPWMGVTRLKVDLESGVSWGRLESFELENL